MVIECILNKVLLVHFIELQFNVPVWNRDSVVRGIVVMGRY